MARTKLEIDPVEFQAVVSRLEAEQSFPNPSHLWKAVEETDWAKGLKPRPLTASVAYQRAKELGIKFNTKPGKRGAPPRVAGTPIKRVSRREKLKPHAEAFAEMRRVFPLEMVGLEKTIRRAERGSLKAAVKLKCLECVCFVKTEIRDCRDFLCPLNPFRPYQRKKGEVAVEEEAVEEEVAAAE